MLDLPTGQYEALASCKVISNIRYPNIGVGLSVNGLYDGVTISFEGKKSYMVNNGMIS